MIVLILAGGGGTRLWPLSTENFPKQFLHFGKNPSFLQKTVLRFIKNPSVSKILISTHDQYRDLVQSQLALLDPHHLCEIISEPLRKNTAPAIAYSLRYLEEVHQISSQELILVVPADHYIESESAFHDYLTRMQKLALSHMIVFGVTASKPETGYGYIKIAEPLDPWVYKIANFEEKPDLAKAEKYILSGEYYWNSGIFLFSVDMFWNELKLHSEDIYEISRNKLEYLRLNYCNFPNISIDYALMEKTKQMLLCPMALDWSDMGSWDSVYECLEKDQAQNVVIGCVENLETYNTLVIGNGKKIVSTIHLNDLLIIDTENALLISKKGDSQKVKKIFQSLYTASS